MKLQNLTKIAIILGLSFSLNLNSFAADNKVADAKPATKVFSEQEKYYALGYMSGVQLLTEAKVNKEQFKFFIEGIKAVAGTPGDYQPKLTESELKEAINQLYADLLKVEEEKAKAESDANIKAGKEYFDKYLKTAGVKKDATGFAYKIIKEGKGNALKSSDVVTVLYTGKLVDGSIFDAQTDKAKPATFPLSGVIPGFRDAILKIKDGGKIEFVLPPELAYGSTQAGPIAPNSTLTFEVELLSHKAK